MRALAGALPSRAPCVCSPPTIVPKIGAVLNLISGKKDLENIKKNIQLKLAKFKNPHSYFFIDELPRNTMGKVQKNKLRDDYS